jgi:hypothetical protein
MYVHIHECDTCRRSRTCTSIIYSPAMYPEWRTCALMNNKTKYACMPIYLHRLLHGHDVHRVALWDAASEHQIRCASHCGIQDRLENSTINGTLHHTRIKQKNTVISHKRLHYRDFTQTFARVQTHTCTINTQQVRQVHALGNIRLYPGKHAQVKAQTTRTGAYSVKRNCTAR